MAVGRIFHEREISNEIKKKVPKLDCTVMFTKLTARSNYCNLKQAVSVCSDSWSDDVGRVRLGHGFDGPGFGSRQGKINFLSPERSDGLWSTCTEHRGS